jgi:hypothetical protein
MGRCRTPQSESPTAGAVLRSLTQIPAEELLSVAAVAAVIKRVADAERPPLHLAIGHIAAEAIHTELAARLRDLKGWEEFIGDSTLASSTARAA